jgi:hypothetical protein
MTAASEKRPGSAARRPPRPSVVDRITSEVAAEHGLAPECLRDMKRFRQRKYTKPRHEAWRRIVQPNTSIVALARLWPCDHTTILFALNKAGAADVRQQAD